MEPPLTLMDAPGWMASELPEAKWTEPPATVSSAAERSMRLA